MKKNIFILLFLALCPFAQAADHYFVTGTASKIIAMIDGTSDCSSIDANQQIIDNAVEELKAHANTDAIKNCALYAPVINLPVAVLIQNYKVTQRCMTYGSRMNITVSGAFECKQQSNQNKLTDCPASRPCCHYPTRDVCF